MEDLKSFKARSVHDDLNRKQRRAIKKMSRHTFFPGMSQISEDERNETTIIHYGDMSLAAHKEEIPIEELIGELPTFENDREKYKGILSFGIAAITEKLYFSLDEEDLYSMINEYLFVNFTGFCHAANECIKNVPDDEDYAYFSNFFEDFLNVLVELALFEHEPIAKRVLLAIIKYAFPNNYKIGTSSSNMDIIASQAIENATNLEVIDESSEFVQEDNPDAINFIIPIFTAVISGAQDGPYTAQLYKDINDFLGEKSTRKKDNKFATASIFQGTFFTLSAKPEPSCEGNDELRHSLAREIATEILGHAPTEDLVVSSASSPREWRAFATELPNSTLNENYSEEEAYTNTIDLFLKTLPAESVRKMTKQNVASAFVARQAGILTSEECAKNAAVIRTIFTHKTEPSISPIAYVIRSAIEKGIEDTDKIKKELLAEDSAKEIEDLRAQIASLNEQLNSARHKITKYRSKIDALREQGNFTASDVEDQETEETSELIETLSDEDNAAIDVSYEDQILALNDFDVLLVTGNVKQLSKFKEAFPGWTIVTEDDLSTADVSKLVCARDMVLLDTINMNHALFYKFGRTAKNLNIPIAYLPKKRNMEIIVHTLYRILVKGETLTYNEA